MWLRARILNSLVFSLSTTVRVIRDSLREADQSFSARTCLAEENPPICGKISESEVLFACGAVGQPWGARLQPQGQLYCTIASARSGCGRGVT